ncbi:MAG: hypothetical protein KGL39_29465 [Patescibacteria group bacterium]|nr:hypothetical protein [Patescibacteria group bacterium]
MTHDFRDAAFSQIHAIMRADPNVLVLTNDMGAMGLDLIAKEFPERVINVGIAEQNTVSVAAGLAISGKTVFVYGIIAHIVFRAFEQIRVDVCLHNLPVIILGVGAGLSYGSDGPTHHGTEDMAAMLSLPNMVVFNPSDVELVSQSVEMAYWDREPAYIRLDKEPQAPLAFTARSTGSNPRILREGKDLTIFTTGNMVKVALAAAATMENEGPSVSVVDVWKFSAAMVLEVMAILRESRTALVLEENSAPGVLSAIIDRGVSLLMLSRRAGSLCLDEEISFGATTRAFGHKRSGLMPEDIVYKVRALTGWKPPIEKKEVVDLASLLRDRLENQAGYEATAQAVLEYFEGRDCAKRTPDLESVR